MASWFLGNVHVKPLSTHSGEVRKIAIFADVGWASGSEKVPKGADVI